MPDCCESTKRRRSDFEYHSKYFGYWTTGKCPSTLWPQDPQVSRCPMGHMQAAVVPAALGPGVAICDRRVSG